MNSKARAAITEAKANLARMEQEETDEINENHDGSLFEDPVERWKRENREIEEQSRHVRAERKLREEIIALRQQLDDLTTSQIIALRQQLDDLTRQLVEARKETADTKELLLTVMGETLKELSEQLLDEVKQLIALPADWNHSGEVIALPNPLSRRRA